MSTTTEPELSVLINLPADCLDNDDPDGDVASIRFTYGNARWTIHSNTAVKYPRKTWLDMVLIEGLRSMDFGDCYGSHVDNGDVKITGFKSTIAFSVNGARGGEISWSAPVEACRCAFEQVADAMADFEVRRAAYRAAHPAEE